MKKRPMLFKTLKVVFLVFLAVTAAIQLVPVKRSNPAIQSEPLWATSDTKELVRKACYDCHSNETKWPVYSYIAPFSWFVANHVNEGRRKLNFSEWNGKHTDEIIEEIKENEMPLKSYLLLHSEARLKPDEKEKLLKGLQTTFMLEDSAQEKNRRDGFENEH